MDPLRFHEGGKLETASRVKLRNKSHLSVAYTPGVAEVSRAISEKPELVKKFTVKSNTIAVVTDGSAVLGLGNIGPEAALPVMEGKCLLFKRFGDVDAFPICVKTQKPREIVKTVAEISPVFGGINLEDISAPRCFEIEKTLVKKLDIPVMHDDQHGTAVVTLAALFNALKLTDRDLETSSIVISGAGAAGIAVAEILLKAGARDVLLCDSRGILHPGREGNNPYKERIARKTNKNRVKGTLEDAVRGRDVFIGLSAPNILTEKMVSNMARDPIIFAMANPVPEIMPEKALRAGASVVATGRSDYPNQVNNVLAFPGIFRGALDSATKITDEIKISAAEALASCIKPKRRKIIPDVFDLRAHARVAEAVAKTAWETGSGEKPGKNYFRKVLTRLRRVAAKF
ncbi:MAG: NADP-dependent malic enzyme [Candidatus Micrarchaeota archaeon]|nr:NADP-dependent malic enzyme [Candidatus Micrarchaeota archaeon]